jgi:hypothetical protein
MKRLQALTGKRTTVTLPTDQRGLTGRECPVPTCAGYFKVKFGTGLKGENPCFCAYCGHEAGHREFTTADQKKYIESFAFNLVSGAVLRDLREAFDGQSYGGGIIQISTSVQGKPHPIRHYRERDVETGVTCSACTLEYAVFGAFAFCPDCHAHNSVDIVEKNFALIEKTLALIGTLEPELADQFTGNALEDAVSSFDGFGRELARVNSAKAAFPAQVQKLSFQNLVGVDERVGKLFGLSLKSALGAAAWEETCRAFQKRHLLAHSMGIVDDAYLTATSDPRAIKGRKISIDVDEIARLIDSLRLLAAFMRAKI